MVKISKSDIFNQLNSISSDVVEMTKADTEPMFIFKHIYSHLDKLYEDWACNINRKHTVTSGEEEYYAELERNRISKYATILASDKQHVFRVMRNRILKIGIPFEENYKLIYKSNGDEYNLRYYIPCDRLCIEISQDVSPSERDKKLFRIKIKTIRVTPKDVISYGSRMKSLVERLEKLNRKITHNATETTKIKLNYL